MKKLLVLALVCMMASAAGAAELALMTPDGNMHGASDPLVLEVSETAVIHMTLDLYSIAPYPTYPDYFVPEEAAFANIFMDSVEMAPVAEPIGDGTTGALPLGEPDGSQNMEIYGIARPGDPVYVWGGRDYSAGTAPLSGGPVPFGSGISWEDYDLIASNGSLVGPDAAGFTRYIIDEILIHCIAESTDQIFFESPTTQQGTPSPRVPQLVFPSLADYPVLGTGATDVIGEATYGSLGFRNAYLDQTATKAAKWYVRDGFWVMQVPEPTSLALLALGGLAVLRRRK